MNQVQRRAHDTGGYLYDPEIRSALARLRRGGDTSAMEAATAIRSAAHAIEWMRARGAESRGLSAGALDLVLRLGVGSDEGSGISELARSLGVTARNVTGLVDTLEREGVVERAPDPRDRRGVLARLTAAGRRWVEGFQGSAQLNMQIFFRGFTDAELAQIRHLCLCVVDNVATCRAEGRPDQPAE